MNKELRRFITVVLLIAAAILVGFGFAVYEHAKCFFELHPDATWWQWLWC